MKEILSTFRFLSCVNGLSYESLAEAGFTPGFIRRKHDSLFFQNQNFHILIGGAIWSPDTNWVFLGLRWTAVITPK